MDHPSGGVSSRADFLRKRVPQYECSKRGTREVCGPRAKKKNKKKVRIGNSHGVVHFIIHIYCVHHIASVFFSLSPVLYPLLLFLSAPLCVFACLRACVYGTSVLFQPRVRQSGTQPTASIYYSLHRFSFAGRTTNQRTTNQAFSLSLSLSLSLCLSLKSEGKKKRAHSIYSCTGPQIRFIRPWNTPTITPLWKVGVKAPPVRTSPLDYHYHYHY
ncbi:hypothetical protein BX666DRAFT_461925 [Dichotomocladium elegans]|nr:hypothetical protein BX666DRAFT_461925 [Dichotomocladium elegans]